MKRFGQTIHLGQQVLMIEVRAAVQDHDGQPMADVADVQPQGTTPYEAVARDRAHEVMVCHSATRP